MARIHVSGDRSLTVNETICLVYSFCRTGPDVNDATLKIMPNLERMYDNTFYSYKFGRIDLTELPKHHPANVSSDERAKIFGMYDSDCGKVFRHFFSPMKTVGITNSNSTNETGSNEAPNITNPAYFPNNAKTTATNKNNGEQDPLLDPSEWKKTREDAANGKI